MAVPATLNQNQKIATSNYYTNIRSQPQSLLSYYMIYKIAKSDLFRLCLLFSKNITAY
jgi:hypothetical protein